MFITAVIVSLLNIGFLNCAKTSFSNSGQALNDSNEALDSGRDPEVITKNCALSRDNGTLVRRDEVLTFDRTHTEVQNNRACAFGQDGNLSTGPETQRARYEQRRLLELPAGAELCDLELELVANNFRYDDMFYFALNGHVVSSNNKSAMVDLRRYPLKLTDGKSVSAPRYDWSGLVDKRFSNDGGESNNFCLGEQEGLSNCQWPRTEQTGSFRLSFAPEILIHLGAKSSGSQHELMFAVTGDDDPNVDCAHSGFNLNVSATYYVK